jgi:SAM-dependent methyltransferase
MFHVEDRVSALSEIRRVLRPGGTFVATIIGHDHLKELRALAPPGDSLWARTRERFTIEKAPEELAPFFIDVAIERYPDSLEVTDAEAVVDFLRSNGDQPPERLDAVRMQVAEAIARDGLFHVAKDTARLRARKP